MHKAIAAAFVTLLTVLGASMEETSAQGKCWNGTIVNDLKDCPREPGTKLSGGEKKSKVESMPLNFEKMEMDYKTKAPTGKK
jgi:hypothetical protein